MDKQHFAMLGDRPRCQRTWDSPLNFGVCRDCNMELVHLRGRSLNIDGDLFGSVAGTMQSVGIGVAPSWDFEVDGLCSILNTTPVFLCRLETPV